MVTVCTTLASAVMADNLQNCTAKSPIYNILQNASAQHAMWSKQTQLVYQQTLLAPTQDAQTPVPCTNLFHAQTTYKMCCSEAAAAMAAQAGTEYP